MRMFLPLLIALVAAWPARAQTEPQVLGRMFARTVGQEVQVAIELEIPPHVHVFGAGTSSDMGIPLEIALAGAGVSWQPVVFPPTQQLVEPEIGLDAPVYYERPVFYARGAIATGTAPGELSARVTGQYCTEGEGASCYTLALELRPEGSGGEPLFAAFPAGGTGLAGPAAAPTPTAPTPAAPTPAAAAPGEDGTTGTDLFTFLLAAVGAGLLALVMPCTYPMIPITISFFTKQAEKRGGRVLPLSLAYGAGIVGMFVLIGVVVGEPIARFATHWVTNLVIGGVFFAFALSLFGCYEIRPPSFLLDASVKASSTGGYLGVFLMGTTLVITSFTCTMPFVGSVLAIGAQQGGYGTVVLGMAAFGLTMAIPFVMLSLVPGRLKAMPRSGQWMETTKVALGFVELAAALKFISNAELVNDWQILPRELFLILWLGIFAAMAGYLLGLINLKGGASEGVGPWRMSFGLGALLFALYCGYGAAGYQLDPVMVAIVPPYSGQLAGGATKSAAPEAAPKGHAIVKEDFAAAVARAKAEGKKVLVNFTGVT